MSYKIWTEVKIAQYTRITGVYCSIYKNHWCILLNIQESVVYILNILSQFHHTPLDLLVKVNLKFHCIANYAHMYNQATTVQCENTLVHIGLCTLTITHMHTGMYAHMYTHTHTYVPGLYRVWEVWQTHHPCDTPPTTEQCASRLTRLWPMPYWAGRRMIEEEWKEHVIECRCPQTH